MFEKQRYAVDIDGVLYDFMSAWERAYKDIFGRRPMKAANSYDLRELYNMSERQIKTVWRSDELTAHMSNIKPFKLSDEVMKACSDDSIYLTARSTVPHESGAISELRKLVTEQWLESHGLKNLPVYYAQDKVSVMNRLGIRHAFEDAPKQVKSMVNSGCRVIMPTHFYNEHEDFNDLSYLVNKVEWQ